MANSVPNSSNYSTIFQYGSWIVIAVVLTGAAQFDTTAKLAAAFAYLILVAAILFYGPEALKNINLISGGSGPLNITMGTPGQTLNGRPGGESGGSA